ncbi:hypothetical protein [Pelosinus propionicus]|uniref:Uncharacterized protein n=1 Tax=Pelosinus propionicus DSM 13327 TaxID=1123291 RepID=A0A1I4PB25_9FIRM|nr:hypothetical protein [Pelosinus propionicus]SFM24909.1 hypothetical protein SAMN04490355_106036 [Pelosinus propionicus DSM 13327]
MSIPAVTASMNNQYLTNFQKTNKTPAIAEVPKYTTITPPNKIFDFKGLTIKE